MSHATPHGNPTGLDPEYQDDAARALGGEGPRRRQPQGLWVLFITEMWERFSYYGMRALLVLYLIASTNRELENGETNWNPGFGWSNDDAYLLYGLYTWAVYLTPIFGGWIADKFLGTHRSMLVGGWIIALGHITLAASEFFGHTVGQAVTLQSSPGGFLAFMTGLLLIIIGTGFFKPCVSVMVGQLYGEDDPRRDSGFTIFYMGINLGAFLAPLVAGTLGEKVGWHWGFGSAAVGMILGLIFYQLFRPRFLAGIGLSPGAQKEWDAAREPARRAEEVSGSGTLDYASKEQPALSAIAWQRIGVILILAFVGNIVFWAAFEQAGSSMNVFAAQNTDRTVWGLFGDEGATTLWGAAKGDGFPATWYQSVNPLAIILFAPLFAWLWIFLDRRGLNPSTPAKFALGLWLLGLAFLAMVLGAMEARGANLAGPHWLLITYVVITWGELCLSPVGLSMVTKLAPARLQSLMMGIWFFSFSLSNLLAGFIARFSTRFVPDLETGEPAEMTFVIEGLPGFFLLLVLIPLSVGVVVLLLTPVLKRMMHGVK